MPAASRSTSGRTRAALAEWAEPSGVVSTRYAPAPTDRAPAIARAMATGPSTSARLRVDVRSAGSEPTGQWPPGQSRLSLSNSLARTQRTAAEPTRSTPPPAEAIHPAVRPALAGAGTDSTARAVWDAGTGRRGEAGVGSSGTVKNTR